MAVVINAVFLFEVLDVAEGGGGVRAGDAVPVRFAGVEEDFFEAVGDGHALVLGEIVQKGGETFFEAEGHIDAFDGDGRALGVNVVTEGNAVAVEIDDGVIA